MGRTFYEFFAGGGMARLGLGAEWRCAFANEWDPVKARTYSEFFGPDPEPLVEDVAALSPDRLPGKAALSWASFPCQDLSLAGAGAGLNGGRSGTFFAFWDLMRALHDRQRAPGIIVLENVVGLLSSHGGRDFRAILEMTAGLGYVVGAVVVDAVHFLPQSRPRLFVIAVRARRSDLRAFEAPGPVRPWHPKRLVEGFDSMSPALRKKWVWWRLPQPEERPPSLGDLILESPNDVPWRTPEETAYLVSLMSDLNRDKLQRAQAAGRRLVGTVYRRSRPGENRKSVQRAELRLDGVAGCLRTPAGGSSRQIVLEIDGARLRSRLLSAREAARLMGLPDAYMLPRGYNDAYHLIGDGVGVPVVGFLERHLLNPLAELAD